MGPFKWWRHISIVFGILLGHFADLLDVQLVVPEDFFEHFLLLDFNNHVDFI